MAKLCQVNRNKKREKMVAQYAAKRAALKAKIADKNASPEEVFEASIKLAKLPRNSSKTRIHNRCKLTGRSRGVYRKLEISRIELRRLSSEGQVPGMKKSSW
ncbi:MAG: 30S ribosomal protein S14 [Alphaproteobacteria bacterium]|nr:30S ribosomal protein S14 [Alphaproteobacteria bacterium]